MRPPARLDVHLEVFRDELPAEFSCLAGRATGCLTAVYKGGVVQVAPAYQSWLVAAALGGAQFGKKISVPNSATPMLAIAAAGTIAAALGRAADWLSAVRAGCHPRQLVHETCGPNMTDLAVWLFGTEGGAVRMSEHPDPYEALAHFGHQPPRFESVLRRLLEADPPGEAAESQAEGIAKAFAKALLPHEPKITIEQARPGLSLTASINPSDGRRVSLWCNRFAEAAALPALFDCKVTIGPDVFWHHQLDGSHSWQFAAEACGGWFKRAMHVRKWIAAVDAHAKRRGVYVRAEVEPRDAAFVFDGSRGRQTVRLSEYPDARSAANALLGFRPGR